MREEIEKEIIDKAIIKSNTRYYSCKDAIKLIDACEQKGIAILGIDAFYVDDSKTQPFLEHSIDYSESDDVYEKARCFLKLKESMGFVFEVVY